MNTEKLNELKRKAARYDWLVSGWRGDYVWYHVLSDDDKNSDFLEDCIDNAIARDKIGES